MQLPEGWRKSSLSSVAEVRTGIAKGKQNLKDPIELPYLRVANVQDGYIDLSEVKLIQIERNQIERFSLQTGDVLMTEGGDFDKLGRGDVWNGQINPCLHQNHVFAVRTNQLKLNSYFLAALSASYYGKKYFLSCSKQSTNLASINSTQLKDFPVLLPPQPEQQKIAQILSTWDKAIEKLDALIAAKQKRKKALMQQLLTGKKRFSEFGEKWQKTNFDKIFKPEKLINKENLDFEVLSVTKNGIVAQADYFNKEVASDDKSKYLIAPRGSLVMSGLNFWMGSIDFQTEFDYGIVSPAYKVFNVSNPTVSREYLFFYVRSHLMIRILMAASVQGASIVRRNLDMDILNNSTLTLPSFEEQQKIASVLTAADAEIETNQKQLAALKEQKKGLMQQLLTGKLRVKLEKEH